MTDEERIELLKTAPLKVPLIGWDKFWHVVQRVCAVISVLALATAAVGIVLVFQLAVCTNTNLGARNAPNAADRNALMLLFSDKPHGLVRALSDIGAAGADIPQRQSAFLELGDAFKTYNTTVATDNQIRDAHPIGKC